MISVIVPVYNIEDYLRRCLDSILTSTYKDYELILVDDGSTDSSSLICNEYAERDKRISVIHQENKGLSPARNAGLEKSKGEYILMIDGDDCIHSQMIEILHDLITSDNYDFVMCSHKRVHDINSINLEQELSLERKQQRVLSQNECMHNLHLGQRTFDFAVAWNKLYKRNILKGLFFNYDAAQDVEFNNQVYQRIQKAIYIPERLYFYIQRSGSFQNRQLSQRHFDTLITFASCLNDIPNEESLYRSFCLRRIFRRMLTNSFDASGTTLYEYAKDQIKHLRKETIKEFRSNDYIPFVEKHALAFLTNHLKLNDFLWRLWYRFV